MADYDSLYHNCRWCKYYDKGKCCKLPEVAKVESLEDKAYKMSEEGYLSDALREGLNLSSIKMPSLTALLNGYGVSKKRALEIVQAVKADLGSEKNNVIESLDASVSKLLQNTLVNPDGTIEGFEIPDPTEFYCKHFW